MLIANRRDKKFDPVVRRAEHKAFCRACSQVINKGDPMVSWYSTANRGMHIHLDLDCAQHIGHIAKEAVRMPPP
jgi:hypothetical protein